MEAIYFDMDGTIANLYAVEDWEQKLRSHNVTPYSEAAPMVDMNELCELCEQFQENGITIGVISWLSIGSTKEYDAQVRAAKREWLDKHFPVATEIHLVKYGTTKLSTAKHKNSVLVDDNAKVREGWHGVGVVDATKNILEELAKLLDYVEGV